MRSGFPRSTCARTAGLVSKRTTLPARRDAVSVFPQPFGPSMSTAPLDARRSALIELGVRDVWKVADHTESLPLCQTEIAVLDSTESSFLT